MSLKKRQTALGIASKLPVADLLPMLARPARARFSGVSPAATDCNCVKTAHALHRTETRSCADLEEENTRPREVIAHLAVSIGSAKSVGYAAD